MIDRGSRVWYAVSSSVVVLIVLGLACSRTLYPYDLGQYEAGIWAPARLIFGGDNPYEITRTRQPPYVMAPYGPAYYWIVGFGLRAFGSQFWFGRVVAASGIIAAACCIAALTHRFLRDGRLALLSVVAFLSQLPVQSWTAVQRPDGLSLGLGMGAITVALAGWRGLVPLVLSSALAAGSVLSRQTSVLPLAVIPGWYFVTRRPRAGVAFLALVAAAMTAVTIVLNSSSHGGYVWQQIVLPSEVPRTTSQFRVVLQLLAAAPPSWLAIGLCTLGLLPRPRTPVSGGAARRPAELPPYAGLIGTYLVAAVLLAAVTCSRQGSNVNYWLEACAVAALAAPLAVRRGCARRIPIDRACVLGAVAFAVAASVSAASFAEEEYTRWQARPYFDDVVSTLSQIEPRAEPFLSVYPELVAYAGRQYHFNDAIQYDNRSPAHRRLLLDSLRARRFPAVVLPYDVAPEGYERVELPHAPPARNPAFLFVRR